MGLSFSLSCAIIWTILGMSISIQYLGILTGLSFSSYNLLLTITPIVIGYLTIKDNDYV